jgi:hypothetical protein
MSKIFSGRYTAKTDQPFVVFLIRMRVNKWWRFDKWIPVASAMGPMLQTFTDRKVARCMEFQRTRSDQYWFVRGAREVCPSPI